jgi:hypothetical protein
MASPTAPAATLPQPQTTLEPPGGPFIRYVQRGYKAEYQLSGLSLNQLITTPLVSEPGYLRSLRYKFTLSGGTGTAAVTSADAPYNLIQNLNLWDPYGIPLISVDGYSLYLINKYSGQLGLLAGADAVNLPSFSALNSAGNGSFALSLPLEFAKAYGLLVGADASAVARLQVQLSSQVFSTQPATPPSVTADLNASFYWLPAAPNVAPPLIGATHQWIQQVANPTIGSGSSVTVQAPRVGAWLDTIILILRDSTNARIDAWPTRIQFGIDGVPYLDVPTELLFDEMYQWSGGLTRPTGVLVLSRKNSLSQLMLGLFDTMEEAISTNTGTQLTFSGMPWGTITNAPATLTVLAGQIVPAGNLTQGALQI